MVIRNDIKDYGNMFIDKTNKMTRNSLVNNEEYEGLLITPLVEKFKDSLKTEIKYKIIAVYKIQISQNLK